MEPADPLGQLGSQVADGEAIDWAEVRSSAADADLGAIAQLQALERIARAHDSDTIATDAPATGTDRPSAVFEWGPVQVLERVGAGSFGDVYRAWDRALNREVALKLLRTRVADSTTADVLREGQLLARVRHPNVMAVYGAREEDGQVGLWGEFLRGRTLADIVEADGTFAEAEAALYGISVCRALAAVHKAGLLHRDVKAQNVMREAGGRLVLMDFGLGQPLEGVAPSAWAGTPAYLAPELLNGQPATVRSDVYAVGVLLFYLVTGEFPVSGRTHDALRRAHAAGERRRLQDQRPDLSAAFARVVERALAADPAARHESAGALLEALAGVSGGVAATVPAPMRRATAVLVVAAVAVAGAVLGGLASRGGAPGAPGAAAFALTLTAPPGLTFTEGARNVPALSPDGRTVAFVATDATGATQLHLRDLDSLASTAIAGTFGASSPFWAPDSQALGFFTASGLHWATRAGARSETLVRLWEDRGASWGRGNVIVFAGPPHEGLSRLTTTGEAPEPITTVDRGRGEQAHMWPQFLPDDSFLYFVQSEDADVRGVYRRTADGAATRVLASDAGAVFGDGQLFFVRDGTLYAQAFDVTAGAVTGQPVAVASDVGVTYNARPTVSVAATGRLVYAPRTRDFRRLVWFDLAGRELGTVAPADQYRNPSLSRDGRYLAVEWHDTTSHIRVFDLAHGGWTQVNASFREQAPQFGPGHELATTLTPNGRLDLFRVSPFGGTPRPIAVSEPEKHATDWSPDGQTVLYNRQAADGTYDVWAAAADGSRTWPLVAGAGHQVDARFSPDGRSIAYAGTESGRMEVYVRTPWDTGTARRLSSSGGYDPVWRSAQEVFYLDPRGVLSAAAISAGPGRPARALFATTVATPGASRNHYVVAPDGQRVLIAAPLTQTTGTGFVVRASWRPASQ